MSTKYFHDFLRGLGFRSDNRFEPLIYKSEFPVVRIRDSSYAEGLEAVVEVGGEEMEKDPQREVNSLIYSIGRGIKVGIDGGRAKVS